MRATQFDRETAQAFGIPVERVYAGVFALGAMLAAIAAVLIVPIQQAHYLMGHDPLLLSFIVVIIGGLGSLRGTLVAALLIGLSDGIISMFFSPTLAKMIATARLRWCWCSARKVCSGRRRDERRLRQIAGAACAGRRPSGRRRLAVVGLSQDVLARVLVLAVFAMGYNLLFGYTGLLSLGHAMFFSAGLYGAGLTVYHLGWTPPLAFAAGLGCGLVLALAVGLLALRTTGVAFMIVTMMFAQVFYLADALFR